MINISVNVPLQGAVLDSVLRAQKILDEEMKISFQKKNQSVPHINLLSGKITHINIKRLRTDVVKFNKKIIKKNFKIKTNGLGVFIADKPVVYVRYHRLKIFLAIRKFLILGKYFYTLDNSTATKLWTPKTTIAHKDTSLKNLSNIVLLLSMIDFYEDFKVKKINLTSFSSDKPEVTI